MKSGKVLNKKRCLAIVGMSVLVGIAIFVSVFFAIQYADVAQLKKIIDGGITAQATLVHIETDSMPTSKGRSSDYSYKLYYEYIDENGLRYYGYSRLWERSQEEAETHIGKKIEIYIDGKGNSVSIYYKPDFATPITLAIVLPIVIIAAPLGAIALWKYKIKTEKKRQEKIDELTRAIEEKRESRKQERK